MKRTYKIIAVSLIAAMTASLAACSGNSGNSKAESSAASENTSVVSETTTTESSVSESETPSETSDTSKTESSVSSKTESSEQSKAETSKAEQSKAEQSRQSEPTTSKPVTTSEPNKTQNSTPTNNPSTNENSKPTTSNNTQTSKPTTPSNTQTSKPTETSQTSKPTETKPVTPPSVKSVTLNKTSLTLTVGETSKLTYSISPSNASYKAEWSTSNNSVASISGDGTVTAKSAGKANITIKTSNGKSATCQVTVKAKQTESKPTQPSKPMTKEEKIAAAFQAPYEGKLTGWQDTVIEYLREVGERQYNMKWRDSFYVRDKGYTYNCSFNFPISNFDCKNGERFRESCLWQFEQLKNQLAQNDEDITDGYTNFKIVIEDLGYDEYHDAHRFFVYLCYG